MESVEQEVDTGELFDVEDLKKDLSSEFSSLHKSKQEGSRELLKVYLRVRPLTPAEAEQGEAQDCVIMESSDTVLLKPPPSRLSDKTQSQTGQRFHFSKVYGPECGQKELFEGTVKNSVRAVLEGEDSLVFTYGVSNAGKTFTFLGSDSDAGVLPRSLRLLFSSIEGRVFTQMSVKPHRCRDFIKLTLEQQHQEALYKRTLFKLLRENDCPRTQNSTSRTTMEGSSSDSSQQSSSLSEERLSLEEQLISQTTLFSVWVSFCEIYNESIHDLLEAPPSAGVRRRGLRLSQDVKGNSFVRDLHWVQVSGPDEALKVLRLGQKNQSFSSTKLNQLSSRSHSIFSVRLLRVEDGSVPRVNSISELSLVDLAGSERCAKTQNRGDRLKEAGNINTSLLTLGKCISALRHNHNNKLLNHVPFRESKLTHLLQCYLVGRGSSCMLVNINQCCSMHDETLNVLKFSALAQKVVVLVSRALPVVVPDRSASELSLLIDNAHRKSPPPGRRSSSLIGWESSLEDVQEDDDGESEEEQSVMDRTLGNTFTVDEEEEEEDTITVNRHHYQRQVALLAALQEEVRTQRGDKLQFEAQIRQEVSLEFTELMESMQKHYSERLVQERDMSEDRAEDRMKIFKNLVNNLQSPQPSSSVDGVMDIQTTAQDPQASLETRLSELNEELRVTKEQLSVKSSELDQMKSELDRVKASRDLHHTITQQVSSGPPLQSASSLERRKRPLDDHTDLEDVLQPPRKKELLVEGGGGEERGMDERTANQNTAHQEVLVALHEERRAREELLAALQYQTTTKEEERRAKEEVLVSLGEERKGREEERRAKEEAMEALVKEVALRAQQTSGQLQTQGYDKDSQILSMSQEVARLQQEVESLRQEVQTSRAERETLREENRATSQETDRKTQTLEQELSQAKQQLSKVQLISDQLQEKNQTQLGHLEEIKGQLQTRQQEVADLSSRLAQQEVTSERKLEELRQTLSAQQEVERLKQEVERSAASTATLDDLAALNSDLRAEAETLRAKVTELEKEREQRSSETKRQTEDAAAEKDQLAAAVAAEKDQLAAAVAAEKDQLAASVQEMERSLRDKEADAERRRAETEKLLAEKEAQIISLRALQKEKEQQITSLQKALLEAPQRGEEEHRQAVKEAQNREVERRRELLAVAEEAIALKDLELKKRQQNIDMLQQSIKQEADRVKTLTLDLQRKDDVVTDLRDKLADSKKQILQVQREISAMREEERNVKQQLCNAEKTKKQLQNDLSARDRTIQHLQSNQSQASQSKPDHTHLELSNELRAKECVLENMRSVLLEQEETQEQMEQELQERLDQVQELTDEVERLKGRLLDPQDPPTRTDSQSHDELKQEAARAQESLKVCTEKHQSERRKWLDEKMLLIGQAKEAESKRNQEMRKFIELKEKQQRELDTLSSQLSQKEEDMSRWRQDRDSLVSALEVQLRKLLSSNAEKDQKIQELSVCTEKDRQLSVCTQKTQQSAVSDGPSSNMEADRVKEQRESVASQGSSLSSSQVLDSSQISTENGGRGRRFPQPEVEISFSPLTPNRMDLRHRGEQAVTTVKISRSRKRKSGDMWQSKSFRLIKRKVTPEEEVDVENKRNTRTTRHTPKPTHQEQRSTESPSRKEGTLQKIGGFLQSSPTLLGSKAKKMMGLVSGRGEGDAEPSSSSSSPLAKKSKKKVYRPHISSPMDFNSHTIITSQVQEKDAEDLKRRLRSRTDK